MRLNVWGGIRAKFCETMWAAEVVRLPVVDIRSRGGGRIDIHAADRIPHPANLVEKKEVYQPARHQRLFDVHHEVRHDQFITPLELSPDLVAARCRKYGVKTYL